MHTTWPSIRPQYRGRCNKQLHTVQFANLLYFPRELSCGLLHRLNILPQGLGPDPGNCIKHLNKKRLPRKTPKSLMIVILWHKQDAERLYDHFCGRIAPKSLFWGLLVRKHRGDGCWRYQELWYNNTREPTYAIRLGNYKTKCHLLLSKGHIIPDAKHLQYANYRVVNM